MICPECHAEYRPGFHHCADCDVELVDGPQEAAPAAAPPPEKYDALLWRGEDPHLYLALVSSVGHELACYGRPQCPIARNSCTNLDRASELGAFEIFVSETDRPRARWILDSTTARWAEQAPENRDAADPRVKNGDDGDPVGACPLCFGEFDSTSSLCPNCNVPLHTGRRATGEDTGARLLCDLPHPRFVAELRHALESAHIPCNNSNYAARDIYSGRYYVPHYDVLVLDSDFVRATKLMAQVLQHWEFEPGSGFWRAQKPAKTFWPHRAARNAWLPQDLETLVWSGANLSSAASIGMALREHEVPYRLDDSEPGMAKIFVHPADEDSAREILRQVVESAPPE